MFVDKVKIFVQGGKGGNGAVAFRREKYEPSGGPAGGDGGRGGSVILKVDEGLKTLMDFKFKKHFKAQPGEDGKSKTKFGKKGEDMILRVPPGTIVKDAENDVVIADLKDKDQVFVIAKGGRGGYGNAKFATSTRQAPRFAKPGEKGKEGWIVLELKLIADVGLIGFPNVGKSTLLSIISDAKPKIANYHFTTLTPNLGVVKIGEGESYVVADIPGLIEGAHQGVGLGHEFLRHIERTRLMVHVVDISGQEGRDPVDDFYKINEELTKYSTKLAKRPQIVVGNKMDLVSSEESLEDLKKTIEDLEYPLYFISAATNDGIEKLKYAIWNELQTIEEPEPLFDEVDERKLYEFENKKGEDIIIRKEDGIFIVEGYAMERLVDSTNFQDIDSLRHFQEMLKKKGVIDRLKELGIKEEEIVNVCGVEFEFFD